MESMEYMLVSGATAYCCGAAVLCPNRRLNPFPVGWVVNPLMRTMAPGSDTSNAKRLLPDENPSTV